MSEVSNKAIIGGVALLVAIILGGVLLATQEKVDTVNGFEFKKVRCTTERMCYETTVVTNVGIHPIQFYNNPHDLGDILISPGAIQRILEIRTIKDGHVTIVFDADVPGEIGVAATHIAGVLGDRLYQIPTKGAVYGDVTCAASTPEHAIIYVTQGKSDSVVIQDNCVMVLAKDVSSVIKVSESFTMHLLGILPEQ